MKYFLIASVLWTVSAQAQAQGECSTMWIYKPWKSCAIAAHGPDKSAPAVNVGTVDWDSGYMGGGANQRKVCQDLENLFNKRHADHGKVGTLTQATPVSEKKKENARIYVEYNYTCRISVAQYPFVSKASRACGEEDAVTYKVGGTKESIAGDAYCLSCDEYSDPKSKVSCLKTMITEVIEPKIQGVDLRESDVKAVAQSVKALMDMARVVNIPGLSNDVKTFTLFHSFLEKNPIR